MIEPALLTAPRLDAFVPLPKQHEFISSAWRHDYLLYAGGYGSGKSLVGCALAIMLSMAIPGNLGLVGRQHASDLRDSTQRTFFECLPPEWIARWKATESHLWLVNGSEVIFRHLDEPAGLKSLNLGWAYRRDHRHRRIRLSHVAVAYPPARRAARHRRPRYGLAR